MDLQQSAVGFVEACFRPRTASVVNAVSSQTGRVPNSLACDAQLPRHWSNEAGSSRPNGQMNKFLLICLLFTVPNIA